MMAIAQVLDDARTHKALNQDRKGAGGGVGS